MSNVRIRAQELAFFKLPVGKPLVTVLGLLLIINALLQSQRCGHIESASSESYDSHDGALSKFDCKTPSKHYILIRNPHLSHRYAVKEAPT